MKRFAVLCIGILLMVPTQISLNSLRKKIQPAERLGYIPSFEVSYFSSMEYRLLVSQLLFYDAIFYYGDLMDKPEQRPEYQKIYQYVATSVRLNPYNIDSYYFGQAVLTWDARMVREMNGLLQVGVSKRNWDFYLPFFLGFNYSYFLNQYEKAGYYTSIAAKLEPRMPFLSTLAGRYYYQANKTDVAIEYLRTIYSGAKNESVKRGLLTRLKALEAIAFLEKRVAAFQKKHGRPPLDLSELVRSGEMKGIPNDPYGGEFYFDRHEGRVKTTSNLANPGSDE